MNTATLNKIIEEKEEMVNGLSCEIRSMEKALTAKKIALEIATKERKLWLDDIKSQQVVCSDCDAIMTYDEFSRINCHCR